MFRLILPILIPSWRFFDGVAPSPRIEFALLKSKSETPTTWKEFRPRPQHLSWKEMLRRLFYNAEWNDSLFLVSCAERLVSNPTEHSKQEIIRRIRSDIAKGKISSRGVSHIQFRLVFISRQGSEIQKDILYVSASYSVSQGVDT